MMTEGTLVDGRSSATTARVNRKVVFALNASERALFFRDREHEMLADLGVDTAWVDTGELEAENWPVVLKDALPAVLVTAWSSPRLPLDWEMTDACPLRYVCHITGSIRSVVPRQLVEKGLLVSNWGSSVGVTIAEHAMLLILGALRGVTRWSEFLRRPVYSVHESLPVLRTCTLRGRRVGLHGFGVIARELVEFLRPYQVEIAAYSKPVPFSFYEQHGVIGCHSLEELFSRSDIIVECEALTEETARSVTGELLAKLPPDSVFVNIARGALVDEAALLALAMAGHLRVALDVFSPEPPPANSRWFDVPGAVLSPHIAGPTWDTYPECGRAAIRNVVDFLAKGSIEAPISLEKYDMLT